MAKQKEKPKAEEAKTEPKPKTDLELLMATSGLPKLKAQSVLGKMNAEEKAMLIDEPHKAYSTYAFRTQKANVEK